MLPAPTTPVDETEYFVSLERAVWQALKDGDAAADARLLSEDFLGVYASGFADRSDHAGQLRNGPTVRSYELTNPRLVLLADGVVALSYLARFQRVAGSGAPGPESMYVTSIWRREHGTWVNVFSQDTSCEPDGG